ncbi:ribosome-inactivating family protein [Streptomyces sp. 3214.6]|uniref:ribosome-inactivating family protein n=1 Tax=Streptomyces sp. 3214.6 TaxID=1882757 RepID=UPI00090A88FF|nr:ribosome-inactivating family protein [Streptomyces sp. 3214.6]SHH36902.1 Ribosome inactivating protein [Streptomyces sp. 3214.6]
MSAQTLFKPLRRSLTILLVLLAAISGLLQPCAKPASADTGGRQVGWTWMQIDSHGNADLARAYEALIISIRNAAGHELNDGVYVTQNERQSLISVLLYYGDTWLRLWIEPQNLYLRGFTNIHGTFVASDLPEYNLNEHLRTYGTHLSNDENTGFEYNANQGFSLPFDSTYGSINRAAGRDRASVPISAESMWNYFHQLAYVQEPWRDGHRQATALSYLFFTQFISEAVRFDDVFWYMRAAMGTSGWWRQGMSANQITLENNWGRISEWARDSLNSPTTPVPLIITGLATLYHWRDVIPVLNVAKHR